jgi:hypothetical protein
MYVSMILSYFDSQVNTLKLLDPIQLSFCMSASK